jgi:hypothetical protein
VWWAQWRPLWAIPHEQQQQAALTLGKHAELCVAERMTSEIQIRRIE